MDYGFLLSKLLPLFVYPTGSGLLFGLLGLILLVTGRRKTGWFACFLGVAIIAVAASPITAGKLNRGLEQMYPAVAVDKAPLADVIVILGGGLDADLPPRSDSEFNGAGDRLRHGARLYVAARAPIVVTTGGPLFKMSKAKSEAIESIDVLGEWGVGKRAVIPEPDARNTYENAVNTATLMHERGLRRALLVTSASHMPRSMAVFKSQGIDVIAQPVDFVFVEDDAPEVLSWMPSSTGLFLTEKALKEYLGFIVYRWRGWISDDFGYLPSAVANP